MKAYQVLDEAVKTRGITYAELARRAGINAELLRRSLSGERRITADELVVLCRELDLSINDFEQVV